LAAGGTGLPVESRTASPPIAAVATEAASHCAVARRTTQEIPTIPITRNAATTTRVSNERNDDVGTSGAGGIAVQANAARGTQGPCMPPAVGGRGRAVGWRRRAAGSRGSLELAQGHQRGAAVRVPYVLDRQL